MNSNQQKPPKTTAFDSYHTQSDQSASIHQLSHQKFPYTDQHLMNPQNQECFNIQIRKKLHQSKSQNFSLKQQLSQLRKHLNQFQLSNLSLKAQIEQNMQEINLSHKQLTYLTKQVKQSSERMKGYEQIIQEYEQKIQILEQKVCESKSIIQSQFKFISNLNQQNLLLLSIKSALTDQNNKLITWYQHIQQKYSIKQKEIDHLHIQVQYLMQDISNLSKLLQNKNSQILDYQIFINQKRPYFKPQSNLIAPKANMQKLATKIDKYKKKALKYKQQRDYLLAEIQQAKKQIATITIRNYSDSDNETKQNYSFIKPHNDRIIN